MAVTIDLDKIVGENNDEKESQPSLPQRSVASTKASSQSRQTRIPRPLRSPQAFWSFITIALIAQSLICWRIFFPPGPEYATSPPYNLTETVSLITEYYRLLQDLRYLGRDSIAYPPHTGPHAINLTLCHEIGLSQSAIDTLQQLPYITPHEDRVNTAGERLTEAELAVLHEADEDWYSGWMPQSRDIFWADGHFLDYRNDTHLLRSRDPLQRYYIGWSPVFSLYDALIAYNAIPKSAIPLSFIPGRKYGLSIVLDTADGRLVVLDTQGPGNRDPLILNQNWEKMPFEYRIGTKYYEYEVFARLGNEFLKELIVHTVTLDHGNVPGSVRMDQLQTPELDPPLWETWVADVYWEYGWPRGDILKHCRYDYFDLPWLEQETCDGDLLKGFNGTGFDSAMRTLRHKIEVQYMRDWYRPVPRNPLTIDALVRWGTDEVALTEEQIAYAKSDEPNIMKERKGPANNLASIEG